jgi:tRNA (guanine37-N1)-methyltransferase
MKFNIFTLHPTIFDSFFGTSLIARGISQNIIQETRINWRDKYGIGGYNQIDDKPFGGGSGMVIQPDQIYQSLLEHNAVSPLFTAQEDKKEHNKLTPNNPLFFEYWLKNKPTNVTISLTPRGYQYNQKMAEWLAGNFETINILCGRYEGFDHRVDEAVDLELSIGNFVLNGGEVAAMTVIESVSRLIPGFVTKDTSVLHDSFSSELNHYREDREYVIGKRNLGKITPEVQTQAPSIQNLFNEQDWIKNILPFLEHPQYTRPEIWHNMKVPQVLLDGNHKEIDKWRKGGFQDHNPIDTV